MKETGSRNSSSRKGLLGRILGLGGGPRVTEPLIVPRAEHEISRKQMAEEVIKVLYRLHNQGFKAYLVGGAVRDLLLGRRPKDYDVSTDARPDQIKELFVNSRLIGRRFRLAHIVFKGGRVVEVSTFRRRPDVPDEEEGEEGEKDLLIHEDNTWGTPQQDAYRRDFTINALFYNIADFSVIDYVGGLADLKGKIIRTIGDADIRFREDPVRMLRAVEYAARLGFDLHQNVRKAIQKHRKDLRKSSTARIADELINLLKCGAAGPAFREMWNLGLLEILYQDLHNALGNGQADRFFADLAFADRRATEGKPLRDVPLLAMFFLPALREAVASDEGKKGGRLSKGEFLVNTERIVDESQPLFQIPNRRRHQVKQAVLAARKMRRRPSKHRGLASLVERAYFLDALSMLEAEVEASGEHRGVLKEWDDLAADARRDGRLNDPEQRDRRGRRDRRDRGGRRDRSDRGRRGDRGRGRGREGDRTEGADRSRSGPSERKRRSGKDEDRSKSRQQDRSKGGGRGGRGRDRETSRGRAPKAPSRESGRAPSRESGKAPSRESGKAPSREPGKAPSRESGKAPSRESGKAPSRESGKAPASGTRKSTRDEKPRSTQPAAPEPAHEEPVEIYRPDESKDTHGRTVRSGYLREGLAGQKSSLIMDLKKGLENGDIEVPPAEEIPYVVPGQSVNETSTDWSEHVGKADELAADTSTPDREKWGRKTKPREK